MQEYAPFVQKGFILNNYNFHYSRYEPRQTIKKHNISKDSFFLIYNPADSVYYFLQKNTLFSKIFYSYVMIFCYMITLKIPLS